MAKSVEWVPKAKETLKTFTWTWDNCYFSGVKIGEKKIRIIVRSKDSVNIAVEKDIAKEAIVTFMYDYAASGIPQIGVEENYTIPENPHQNIEQKSGKRYVMSFTKEKRKGQVEGTCEIWQWDSDSELKIIRERLQKIMNSKFASPIVESETNPQPTSGTSYSEIFPIIYQPAIDTPKNFLRQVHIHKKNDKKFQITLVFNNEALRRNKLLHDIYEDFRRVIYGRTKDVETFHIILEDLEPKKFNFEGIYSKKDTTLEDDTIHGDKKYWWEFWKKISDRDIDCYYASTRYPKIYVNTSNHALAGHDNNPGLWKWEYVTWGDELPIGVGCMSRNEIEKMLTSDSDFHKIKYQLKEEFGETGFFSNIE